MSRHLACVEWADDGGFTGGKYSRAHDLSFDGGASLRGSSPPDVVPLPFSDPAGVDPEELLVAAVASCHMLWFLRLAQQAGHVVASYRDRAEGQMGRIGPGRYAVTEIVLRPDIAFAGSGPVQDSLDALHREAHERCFIANSLKAEIRIEPPLPKRADGNAPPDKAVSGARRMMMTDQPRDTSGTVDLGGAAWQSDALSGTGGSSGGGTSAGAGQPDGGTLDELEAGLPRMTGGIAAEAATLGPADGALADAAGAMSGAALTGGIGEAVGGGAGRDVGSGTDPDRGDLGGGGGGTGPEGTARPGGA